MPVGILLDVALLEFHVELVGFGQHHHGGGGGVHAALRLGLRHALHAVHARLVLHDAIDAVAGHGEVDLLVAAHGAFGHGEHLDFPSLLVAEVLVHAEEVAGEDAGLVAARARADFHLSILAVLRVGGQQQQANILFKCLLFSLIGIQFCFRHLAELLVFFVGENVLRVGDVVYHILISLISVHHGLQILVVLAQLDVVLHVGHHIRLGDFLANLQPALVNEL